MNRKNANGTPVGVVQSHMGKMTTYMRDGVEVTRGTHTTTNSNRRSVLQVYNQMRANNLNAFCRKIMPYVEKYLEYRESGRYYYHYFMQYNKHAKVYGLVTNREHNQGAALVADYVITQGSLPSVVVDTVSEGVAQGISDIRVGTLDISEDTTVGELAEAVVVNNGGRFEYNDTIVFVMLTQVIEELTEKPKMSCSRMYVHLLKDCSAKLKGVNRTGLGVKRQCLAICGVAPTGGYTWIHVRPKKDRTGVLVSTQRLTVTNQTTLDQYGSVEKMREAAKEMGAKIPDAVGHVKKEEDREVYAAFGVPIEENKSYGAEVSEDDEEAPFGEM